MFGHECMNASVLMTIIYTTYHIKVTYSDFPNDSNTVPEKTLKQKPKEKCSINI